MINNIFLIRNLPKNKKKDAKIDFLKLKNKEIENELEFYKQIFKRRYNSAVFNLRIKTINGKKIWIDKVFDRSNKELLLSLDKDDEVIEWLIPCRCER